MIWFVVFAFIAVNALYVAAEFGAVSVRRSKIQQMADEGHRLAAKLLPILASPTRLDNYIAACQIGITWSSLVLGAFSQAFITPDVILLLQDWGLTNATAQTSATVGVLVLMTTLQVVGGELVPKSLALQYPTRVSLYTLAPMQFSLVIYHWFLKVLNGSGLWILKMLGFSQVGHGHIHSPEEIELLIADSRNGGLLEAEEHRRLARALRLVSRPVRQLMVPRASVVSIDILATREELLKTLTQTRYTRFPVRKGSSDNIVGLLHARDVAAYVARHSALPAVPDVMRPLTRIPETVTADRLFAVFRERSTHQAAVVDGQGVVGLVAVGDLVSELIGDVSGEFRGGQPLPERLADGRVRLPGLMPVDEAQSWLGVSIQGPAETIGGHVLHHLERLPAAGERHSVGNLDIEVERVSTNMIISLLIQPIPNQQGGHLG